MFTHKEITIRPRAYGFHLITQEIIQQIQEDLQNIKSGICFFNLLHTSAGLTLNENADPSVRLDMKNFFRKWIPRNFPFEHSLEGPDDMPAHLLSSLIGTQLQIPIKNGKLVLGTWQGIYLCEFRDHGSHRKIHVTIWQESTY